ncbi:rhomboid family intramembrane serine protease [Flavobacterium sp. JLP]|uniref:rhomboid family intramembrane serine protease n=1 Tax=unclassified Flavobacterium TaxID=196869 RepID=UPI00188BC078|nr:MULTISPECIES: rhomboid family intramembrane serine protease [unclassified Flavobacterium]MBF4491831.1 rhomboid family intramembrane serine protease [Flavobacterium sp. MR2016-29]MBF4505858.1 rhomboid family intramembrane serine protease [Flavobacterium sp. JLP]
MAFGFPATFSQLTPLNNLSKTSFILSAIEICKKLNWIIITVDENELIAVSKSKKNTWNENISFSFDEDAVQITSSSNGNQIYDRGRNKKNTDAFLELYFEKLKDISNPTLDPNSLLEQIKIENENISEEKEIKPTITVFYSFLSIFIPTKDYFITPILIYLNILYYFIMVFSGVHFFAPETQEIIDWGGNYGPLIFQNQWWRLLSACFIPVGFFHLVANCIALAYVGLLLEQYLKKWAFLMIYLFCGVIANLSSLYWNKDIVSADAFGAIFGMYGILAIAFIFKTLDFKINIKIIINIIFLLGLNIGLCLKDEIDGEVKIASFITGIIFGLALCISGKKRDHGLAFITSTATIIILFLFINFKNSQVYIYQVMEYEKRMQEFTNMEKMALEAYSIQYDYSYTENKESTLYLIKDRGIYYWNENITLITELDKLYLPKEIHDQNELLIEYCKLRISLYEMAYKKIVENSTIYDEKMLALNFKIASIVNQIKKAQNKV